MPINIPNNLPAKAELERENIFVMTEARAISQDIRPLNIAILNLMPEKIATETQLLRLLGNTPLQVDIELIKVGSHTPKTTPQSHLLAFYKPFSEIEHRRFDGLVITGAPIEHMKFENVNYWHEICKIMGWSRINVTSTLHICWGAQAGLYYHYGIDKIPLDKKVFGVFSHRTLGEHNMLLRGFDGVFYAPHSRWSKIDESALKTRSELEVLASSPEVGPHIIATKDGKQIFITGHMEYSANTLKAEYLRDLDKGLNPALPHNYFPGDCPANSPITTWCAHANLLFSNWLNYCVYQATPYNFTGSRQATSLF
ncbi:MAG: homoserine O-succinyltransferase [Clostridiales bacterium]|jgi:homoserine O-succinyltransferase|nr:homoserine O-succinyltransferase [Clostridiales bacterium]